MTFEELQIEELNHIISNLKQQLNYELSKNTMLNKQLDALVELGDKISHQNEDQQETIDELQTELKYRLKENKSLYIDSQQLRKQFNRLYKDNEKQSIEINQLYKEREDLKTEIVRLKTIIDMKDDARIELVEENKKLKEENEKLKLGEYTEFRKMISDLWKGVDE